MDSNSEEEEILVFVEFEDPINLDNYNNIHVLGIDTNKPIFQLDDTFFTGTFENPLGTYMFFEEDPSPKCSDPLFDKLPEKNLRFLYKTRKLINVEHAYITPKEGNQEQEHQEVQEPQNQDLKPANFKNIQDALERFKKEWHSKTDSNQNIG
ncbi:unnamed protein product, partial [Brenthis ino]